MLKISQIRNLIVRGLKASTNESVAVAEDGGPQEPYPFTSIKITVLGRKIGQAAEYMKNAQLIHEKDIELVLSVSCVSNTLDSASDLAYAALEYFDVHATVPLQEQHIAIVETTDITDRTTFLTTNYEYRMGFDVRLRVRTKVVVDIEYVEFVEIQIND